MAAKRFTPPGSAAAFAEEYVRRYKATIRRVAPQETFDDYLAADKERHERVWADLMEEAQAAGVAESDVLKALEGMPR